MSTPAGQVTLRPASVGDEALLRRVFASTRTEELAPTGWDDATKAAFLDQQFDLQHRSYVGSYPDGRFLVVEVGGAAAGRLYLGRVGDELRVIDIALLPEHRGRGIGTQLLRDVLAEADREHLDVTLHVERWNPAQRLYERLGFEVVELGEVYVRMRRPRRQVS